MILSYEGPGIPRVDLEGAPALSTADTWADFLGKLPGARCAVLLFPRLDDHARIRITEARATGLHIPLIVATSPEPDNLRHLCEIDVDAVLWPRELQEEISSLVHTVCLETPLRRAAKAIQDAEHLAEPLRRSLARACIDHRPVLSVQQLARLAGCSRQALWSHWKHSLPRPDPPHLSAFLKMVLLVRAMRLRGAQGDRRWDEVAVDLGVSTGRLRRTARRITGHSLSNLRAPELNRLLVGRFIEPLLGRR